jgi:hypothetical protein
MPPRSTLKLSCCLSQRRRNGRLRLYPELRLPERRAPAAQGLCSCANVGALALVLSQTATPWADALPSSSKSPLRRPTAQPGPRRRSWSWSWTRCLARSWRSWRRWACRSPLAAAAGAGAGRPWRRGSRRTGAPRLLLSSVGACAERGRCTQHGTQRRGSPASACGGRRHQPAVGAVLRRGQRAALLLPPGALWRR